MLLNNGSQGFRRAQFGVVPVRSLWIGMKCPGCSEWLDMRDQVKFPPGFKLRPHWHLAAVRTVVILFGALYKRGAVGRKQAQAIPRRHVLLRTPEGSPLRVGKRRRGSPPIDRYRADGHHND